VSVSNFIFAIFLKFAVVVVVLLSQFKIAKNTLFKIKIFKKKIIFYFYFMGKLLFSFWIIERGQLYKYTTSDLDRRALQKL
jgi:hypothetical protein